MIDSDRSILADAFGQQNTSDTGVATKCLWLYSDVVHNVAMYQKHWTPVCAEEDARPAED